MVKELAARGWANKRRRTRAGHERGGEGFTKTSLHRLLTNPTYVGKVRHKGAIYAGEQPGIVAPEVYEQVQALLQRNARTGGAPVRNQFGAVLKGILHCGPCGCAMTPAHTRKGARLYRYYVCTAAQKRGWDACPSKSIPAAEIERVVVERIRGVGRDPAVLQATVAEARRQDEERLTELEAERRTLERDLGKWQADERRLARPLATADENDPVLGRVADLQERIRLAETRLFRVREQTALIRQRWPSAEDIEQLLTVFTPVWEALTPAEQARVVRLLVEQVDYDGAKGKVAIRFHETGIQTLAEQVRQAALQEKRA